MHGDSKKTSFAKSNHPAKKKGKGGLSGDPGKPGKHATLSGKENPMDRTKAVSVKTGKPKDTVSKSFSGENPLFNPGNKMSKG